MRLQEMTNPVLEDAELEAGIAEQIANAKAILGKAVVSHFSQG